MRNHSRMIAAVLALVAAAAGCTKTYAPRGVLPSPSQAPSNPYGAWVHVEYRYTDRLMAEIEGELIAVTADSLYILRPTDLRAIPCSAIEEAQAECYTSSAGLVTTYAVFGTLSTISHGYYLVATAPLWIFAGTAATNSELVEPMIRYPDESLAGFTEFARFPAGMPAGLDRARMIRGPGMER